MDRDFAFLLRRIARPAVLALCAVLAMPAHAEDAPPSARPLELHEAGPAHWRGWLDLRDLAADRLPGTVRARIDLGRIAASAAPVRLTLAVNGFVMTDMRAVGGQTVTITGDVERRFLTTLNRIDVTTQAISPDCASSNCPAPAAYLADAVAVLDGDTDRPRNFASFVPLFRGGIAVEADNARARALLAPAIAAMGPLAPIDPDGPTRNGARIVVSAAAPAGVRPWLRLDRGPAEIHDRDRRVLFDSADLARFTVVQVFETDHGPLLWVRPGTGPLPTHMDLDQGGIALFDGNTRAIAFSPDFDDAVQIVYTGRIAAAPLLPLWRSAIIVVWFILSGVLFYAWRRTPKLTGAVA